MAPVYSLHILCTRGLWLAPFWTAPAQLCVRPLGSIYWVVRPSLGKKKERRMGMKNKTRKTEAKNQNRQNVGKLETQRI
jgi:hypothetical protein